MAETDYKFIDNLIQQINEAEDPESVSNEMVARVLDALNERSRNNTATITDLIEKERVNSSGIEEIKRTIGQANGLAPLDANGKVPAVYLPECSCGGGGDVTVTQEKELIWIGGVVDGVDAEQSSTLGSGAHLCSVVYDSASGCLLLAQSRISGGGTVDPVEGGEVVGPQRSASTLTVKYFRRWADEGDFGVAYDSGVKPFQSRLYVVRGDNGLYIAGPQGLSPVAGGGDMSTRITEDEIDAMFN